MDWNGVEVEFVPYGFMVDGAFFWSWEAEAAQEYSFRCLEWRDKLKAAVHSHCSREAIGTIMLRDRPNHRTPTLS